MSSYVADRIYIQPRRGTVPGLTQSRHWCARVIGLEGKSPVVQIGPRSDWQSPRLLERHRACWTYDLHSDAWYPFDHVEVHEGYWRAWNDQPFTADTVFMANMPRYTTERYATKIAEWTSRELTLPTESAGLGYVVGHMPSIVGPNDKVLPAFDCHAFKLGSGPDKFAVVSGTHPDEIGHYIFEAIIDTLLSDDPVAVSLRSKFTFYAYPNINPQGLYGGYVRAAPDVNLDCNRIWFEDPVASIIPQIFKPVWQQDIGGNLFGLFDCHSTPGANPNTTNRPSGREIWSFINDDREDLLHPFIDRLRDLHPLYSRSMPDNTAPAYFKSIASPRLTPTLELDHRVDLWIDDWRALGTDALKALDDITSD